MLSSDYYNFKVKLPWLIKYYNTINHYRQGQLERHHKSVNVLHSCPMTQVILLQHFSDTIGIMWTAINV